jgi:hypothetical protein
MIVTALRSLVALILAATVCDVANAEARHSVSLQCSGEMVSEGIKAPTDAYIAPRSENVPGTYTMQGNVLIESGGGAVADGRYTLCSSTSTSYLFSTDCSAKRSEYIEDWLQTTDFGPDTSPFYKKYTSLDASLATVNIDRMNLSVDEEIINTHVYPAHDKKRGYIEAPYLISTRYTASCRLVKPKI